MDNRQNIIRQNSLRAWILAARPKTLTAAAVPVIVGMALAIGDNTFQWRPVVLCFLFAFIMQIAANFINDLVDFLKGSDREDRLGPERACAQGWITPGAMKAGIVTSLIAACAIGLMLLKYGGLWLVAVGAACVVFAFLYTTFMSYYGLGDLLVIVFFGFVPVVCTYYVQSGGVTVISFVAALACGLAVDTLLVINNFRDRDADRRSGKKTIIVRFGERFGIALYLLLGVAAAALCLTFLAYGYVFAALMPLLYLIPHFAAWRRMVRINHGRELNMILASTSLNMLLFAVLMLVGFMLSALVHCPLVH